MNLYILYFALFLKLDPLFSCAKSNPFSIAAEYTLSYKEE